MSSWKPFLLLFLRGILGFATISEKKSSKKYSVKWICNYCDCELTRDEYSHSHGVCPYCGAVSRGTFVDCRKEVGGDHG